ncbi:MAG TPA: ArsB/NhaD family transporter [Kofleriaceae bacterium]
MRWLTAAVAAAALGCVAMGWVPPAEAWDAVRAASAALWFLLALLILSLLVGKSGFFDWAAIACARASGGDPRKLFRNLFLLGAAVTAALSLDTTAVLLTPIVLAMTKRLKLDAAPFVVMVAFVANVGSLLLPVSNLTNLLAADITRLSFGAFAARMALPQVVALGVCYAALRIALPLPVAGASELPAAEIPNRGYFRACVAVLAAVTIGYFVAPPLGVPPYAIAFAGAAILAVWGVAAGVVGVRAVRELPLGVFPFAIGLFVLVHACEPWLVPAGARFASSIGAAAAGTAVASNVVNNLPAALLAKSVLVAAHAPPPVVLGALLGADIGPMVTPLGSLATILVLSVARQAGVRVPLPRLLVLGVLATPAILAAATLALWMIG